MTRPPKRVKCCRVLLSLRNDGAVCITMLTGMTTVTARSISSGARKTRPFMEFPRAFLTRGYTDTCRLCAWRAWSRRVKNRLSISIVYYLPFIVLPFFLWIGIDWYCYDTLRQDLSDGGWAAVDLGPRYYRWCYIISEKCRGGNRCQRKSTLLLVVH